MKRLSPQPLAIPPLWVILFAASAILFGGGAVSFGVSGAWHTALIGIVGALASVVMILVFPGKDGPRRS